MNLFDVLFAKKLAGGGSPFPPVIKRKTGNPIEITDAAAAPIVKCVTEIQGSQDLHGQDKPWPPGAGKNKFNKDATYTGSITVEDDDIKFEVLSSGQTFHYNEAPLYISNETVTISATTNGSFPRIFFRLRKLDDSGWMTNEDASILGLAYNAYYGGWFSDVNFPVTYAIPNCLYANFGFGCDSSTSVGIGNIYTFSNVQLEIGSKVTPYAPYSNLCPITAYTEGEIEVRGKNIACLLPSTMENDRVTNGITFHALSESEIQISGTATANAYMTDAISYATLKLLDKKYKAGTYTISSDLPHLNANTYLYITAYSLDGTSLGTITNAIYKDNPYVLTLAQDIYANIQIVVGSGAVITNPISVKFQIEKGSTPTTYEPYTSTTHTTTYPDAIYRGSEDVVNGEVTAQYVVANLSDFTWTYNLQYNYFVASPQLTGAKYPAYAYSPDWLCSCFKWDSIANVRDRSMNGIAITTGGYVAVRDSSFSGDLTAFTNAIAGQQITYELATPTTTSVTPTNLPICTLSGYNRIESSTGEMTIDYITNAYQNFVDTTERALPNTRKGGAKAFEIFETLDNPGETPDEETTDTDKKALDESKEDKK